MSGEESESRSDRLRRRRSQRQEHEDDDTESALSDETAETDKQSKPSKLSVKEEQTPVYMYLPETQARKVNRLYNVLKADYEFEFDESFEKNRHFYPLLIQYGLEDLDSLESSEIRDRLESLDNIE